ncbi:hypothetical protein SSPS47_23005 [Streptomyces sp. S4.7]|uniref:hypothetical protein n=1 Tax=Streptomyces sp. S4.7 TaxID=2705439 RepID=UPI001398C483|nr:hypothetical protein [Streptomyces sp. S4.7]QHY97986.1 hypothetical protein SSPS47_23005 [Streptomyces sp. S4.7]
MHSHRELCERAVDPLEIAAGLEAHGVTDRAAARFRHRDVFSLAEELYARVPRAADTDSADATTPYPARFGGPCAGWALRTLLPGAVCAVAVVALRPTEGGVGGGVRSAIGVAGAVALAAALTVALRRGPLRVAAHTARVSRLWVCWLLAYVLYGDGLPRLSGGGPLGAPPLTDAAAPLLALAFAVAPAAWCAHLLSLQARRGLADSRGLAEFAARTRPPLLGLLALYVLTLTALAVLAELVIGGDRGASAGRPVATVAVGALLFLARLLTVHGFPKAAATGLVTACAVEASVLVLATAGRVPGLESVSAPVRAVVDAGGAGAVPAVACGAAALGLLIHATVVLPRASAHT